MGNFRDDLVAGLPQTPPSDDSACANIKQVLAGDLESRRQMFSTQAMDLVGEGLAVANQIVDDWERALAASPGRPLSKEDMHYYACVEIRSRIQRMLDADAANGRLVISSVKGEEAVMLDDLVAWAVSHGITVEQDALPGCPPLVDASYQRVHQQVLAAPPTSEPQAAAAAVVAVASTTPSDWKVSARQIADECFDNDTNGNPPTRDCLIRCNNRGDAVGGYAVRVMVIMQVRGIHGPRGLITNAKTIAREALQGPKWWGNKSK